MKHNIFSGSPEYWFQYAESDLELAKLKSSNILFETLCFHIQQAVEKAMKALLISKSVEFPKTHNLKILIDLLPDDLSVPEKILKSAWLTEYAVSSRYPGDYDPITEEEYKKALSLAEYIVKWVQDLL